jgi:hypothetical protein
MDYFGKSIYVVSVEDLIISKLIWIQDRQSVIQMEDIRNLAFIENLNRKYLSKWIIALKLNTYNLINV